MIEFDRVTITYDGARPAGALTTSRVEVDEGELCLVVGRTGVGQVDAAGAVNGLVPHFTGGTLHGPRARRRARHRATHPPRELADVVGVRRPGPARRASSPTPSRRSSPTAWSSSRLPADVMRKRVEETLDLLGLADAAQPRRCASSPAASSSASRSARCSPRTRGCSCSTSRPRRSTRPAAEEVLAAITRLVHDLGVTVRVAEHRLERVVQYADRVVHLTGDGTVEHGDPGDGARDVAGRAAGRGARPARRLGRRCRCRCATPAGRAARCAHGSPTPRPLPSAASTAPGPSRCCERAASSSATAGRVAVREVDLDARGRRGRRADGPQRLGQVVAAVGAPGLRAPRRPGGVESTGRDPGRRSPATTRRALVGLVPQTAVRPAVPRRRSAPSSRRPTASRAPSRSTARDCSTGSRPASTADAHPRDLSEGQRLALVLAIQLARRARRVVLLDEPTRGLDYDAKHALVEHPRATLAADGHARRRRTHDVEFVAAAADRVVVMAEGEIVADGPTTEVIVASPAFAPQVAKILAPLPYLTVAQVHVRSRGARR